MSEREWKNGDRAFNPVLADYGVLVVIGPDPTCKGHTICKREDRRVSTEGSGYYFATLTENLRPIPRTTEDIVHEACADYSDGLWGNQLTDTTATDAENDGEGTSADNLLAAIVEAAILADREERAS